MQLLYLQPSTTSTCCQTIWHNHTLQFLTCIECWLCCRASRPDGWSPGRQEASSGRRHGPEASQVRWPERQDARGAREAQGRDRESPAEG